MGKSIIWRSIFRKHEFFLTDENQIAISVYDSEGEESILSYNISPDDANGISEILNDLAWDANRVIEKAKEEKEVDLG